MDPIVDTRPGRLQTLIAALLRAALRATLLPAFSPRRPIADQRRRVALVTRLTLRARGVDFTPATCNGVPGEFARVRDRAESSGTVLYLHGGAYCLGSPATHRSITSHLARRAGCRSVRCRLPAGARTSVSGSARGRRGGVSRPACPGLQLRAPGAGGRLGRRWPGAGPGLAPAATGRAVACRAGAAVAVGRSRPARPRTRAARRSHDLAAVGRGMRAAVPRRRPMPPSRSPRRSTATCADCRPCCCRSAWTRSCCRTRSACTRR